MGCGASKAAQVVESDITIKDYPTGRSHESSPVHSPQSADTVIVSLGSGGEGEGVRLIPSDQSAIERAVQEGVTQPSGSPPNTLRRPPLETTGEGRTHHQATLNSELTGDTSVGSLPPPVAFEVCMSPDEEMAPKAPLPRRLAKLDSVPELTADMLADKQKIAEERRHKELERKASTRLSKKDRLMREIMAAREMESSQLQSDHSLGSGDDTSATPHQAETGGRERRERHARKAHTLMSEEGVSYDASVEFEVDSTFNTEQNTEFWGGNNNEPGNASHTKIHGDDRGLSTNSKTDDDLFFDQGEQSNLLDSNSHHSEQYM